MKIRRTVKGAEGDYIKIGDRVIPTNTADMGNADYDEVSRRGRQRYDKEKADEAEAKRRAEAAERGSKLQAEIDEAYENDGSKDWLQAYFDVLVPSNGKADTVAGEITRAMMRILYRDWNDGDRFFSGYGWETCMSSAAYLMDTVGGEVKDQLIDIAKAQLEEDAYTNALKKVEATVVDYLRNNPELLGESNEDDSREWDISYKYDDLEAKYDFDFGFPWQVEELLSQGKVDLNDVKWELESWDYFRNCEIEVWDDSAMAYGVDEDTYNELVHRIDAELESWGQMWAEEYGLDDEDEDEDEDYDEDEEW